MGPEFEVVKQADEAGRRVSSLSPQQEAALRQLLELRSTPEWGAVVRRVDRALEGEGKLALTAQEYDVSVAPVIRLRLRRAMMHALMDGAIAGSAAAQILGYIGRSPGSVELEDILDQGKFPNLASDDFSFLREIKSRLRWDLVKLKEAAGSQPS
jgi:hypothetical protein